MSYLVVDCHGCGSPRILDDANETGQCPRCGTTIRVENAQVHARTDELETAQDALGQVNAQRAGGELVRPGDSQAGPPTKASDGEEASQARDEIDRALVQARSVSSERMQVKVTAEGLTEELGTFTVEDWIEAMDRLDVAEPRAREHLQRLARGSIVAEPEHGRYRYIE